MNVENAKIAQISQEVVIKAPPESVWKALTTNIGEWWPADFYAGGEAGARTFELEPRPGGRMSEKWDSGGGVLWGTVVTVDPNVRLQVLGSLFPNWGGPSQWFGTWDLAGGGGCTTLTFSETTMGKVTEAGMADKDEGWRFLWNALKEYLEK